MSKEDLFHEFLSERDLVGAYRMSFTNLASPGEPISLFLDSVPPSYWIYWAFDWASSVEGMAYWTTVNSDWIHLVRAEEMADGNI